MLVERSFDALENGIFQSSKQVQDQLVYLLTDLVQVSARAANHAVEKTDILLDNM